MKVSDLIKALKKYDPEMEVALRGYTTPVVVAANIRGLGVENFTQIQRPCGYDKVWAIIGRERPDDRPQQDFLCIM